MTNGKISIPFLDVTEYDVPIVEFHIRDKAFYGIIDTGAESTIFDSSIRPLLSIVKDSEISIIGVSGESESQNIQTAAVKVWMRDKDNHLFITNVNGYISYISHLSSHFIDDNNKKIAAIFGSDMLNNLSADVDFKKRLVHFKLYD